MAAKVRGDRRSETGWSGMARCVFRVPHAGQRP